MCAPMSRCCPAAQSPAWISSAGRTVARLLRGLLPDGSLLVAADVLAAMLAQLRAASRGQPPGWSRCWRPPKSCRCGPPAWTWSPRSTAFTTSTSAASWPPPPGAAARRPAVDLHPHPAAERADDLGPLLPRFHRARAAPAQPGRHPGRRPADRWAHDDRRPDLPAPAHQSAERLGAQAQARPSRRSLLHSAGAARRHRNFLARRPAPRSPGSRRTCWSSPAGAATTRRSLTARLARLARRAGR